VHTVHYTVRVYVHIIAIVSTLQAYRVLAHIISVGLHCDIE